MKKIILLSALVLSSVFGFCGDVYDEVANAIRSGSSGQVSSYFMQSVDLTILAQENMYSKAQAEVILKDFFSKNPPKAFSILHKGVSKEGSMYAIGNYESSNGSTFRTYFFIKQVSGKNVIQELRFEKE